MRWAHRETSISRPIRTTGSLITHAIACGVICHNGTRRYAVCPSGRFAAQVRNKRHFGNVSTTLAKTTRPRAAQVIQLPRRFEDRRDGVWTSMALADIGAILVLRQQCGAPQTVGAPPEVVTPSELQSEASPAPPLTTISRGLAAISGNYHRYRLRYPACPHAGTNLTKSPPCTAAQHLALSTPDSNVVAPAKYKCRSKEGESNKCRYGEDYSCDQRLELLGGSLRDATAFHLAVDDHVHEGDAAQNDACTTKIVEAQHRSGATLDGTVVLLDDIVQVLPLADPDRRLKAIAQNGEPETVTIDMGSHRKSIVLPALSTARYRYFYSPLNPVCLGIATAIIVHRTPIAFQPPKRYRAMAGAASSATDATSGATWDSFIMRGWSSSATSPLQPV